MQYLDDATLDEINLATEKSGSAKRARSAKKNLRGGGYGNDKPKWQLQLRGQRARAKPAPITLAGK